MLNPRQIPHGPHGGIQTQLLAKLHVDRFESLADRRGDRAFQRDLVRHHRGQRSLRQYVVHACFERAGAGEHLDPLDGHSGCFEDSRGGAGDFRTNSIPRNQNNGVLGHGAILSNQPIQSNPASVRIRTTRVITV